MLTRRSFLSAAAALAGSPALALQRGVARRSQLPPPLASSIAALTSMRGQAKPITSDERRARMENARRLMAAQKIDALILSGGTSLVYFTNIRWGGGERLFACVIPAKGEPFIVCPAFEEDRAREQVTLGPLAGERTDIRVWSEDESPYVLVARGLRDRGLATGIVGLEETMPFVWANGIASAAPQLHVVSGTPIAAGCRMIKDDHELELIRIGCAATLKVYEAVYRAVQPGMTQNQVSDLIDASYRQVGFAGGASVQVGEYTALPHGSITPQTIREGTIIMLDDGCVVEGYQSDITRTFVLGKATAKMHPVFNVVKRAQTAALSAARPGVPLASIDAAARKVIVDAGYGPGFKYFSHRVGHGLGMDEHEWPYLVKNNMFGWKTALTAQPGMVFSDEPGIYIRGEFGVRLEDDMHITSDGAQLFTRPSTSLDQPF